MLGTISSNSPTSTGIFLSTKQEGSTVYTQLKLIIFQESGGISFIGPSAEAINGMGDKLESKRLAQAAGVNTIPGKKKKIVVFYYVQGGIEVTDGF
jgi:hypothetical protein